MKRRSFLAGLGAFLAGLFGWRVGKAEMPDPTIADRKPDGECLARLYRKREDGCYYEIARNAARPGDEVIMLGLDGKRLWKVQAFRVGQHEGKSAITCEDGDIALVMDGSAADLFVFHDRMRLELAGLRRSRQ